MLKAEGGIQMALPVWAQVMLQVAFFAIVILFVYKQMKERVLYKYHPDKWVVLGLSALVFLLPMLSSAYLNFNMSNTVWQYIDSTIFIVLFLWFVDISNGNMNKVRDKINNPPTNANKQSINNPIKPNKPKKNKNRDSRRRK